MQMPRAVLAEFRRHGRRGGLARARRLPAAARASIACCAALRRWILARFGAASLAAAGLPGGELVDQGLRDLAQGRVTQASLLVSLAAPRLRREGVPLPRERLADADHRLFRLLEEADEGLAHARYLALLRQAASFADACPIARARRVRRAR